jgi:hypothetical protein
VVRAVERLGFDARRENGRIELRPPHVADLRDVLGVSVRICDLTSTEVRVPGGATRCPTGPGLRSGCCPKGGDIARRLLRAMDLDGLAWGARNLRASD